MMLEPIPRESIAKVDLIPQAILNRPVSFFADRRNIRFFWESDDLDVYESAALRLNGTPFALRHYRGYPENTTTIYLPREVSNVTDITSMISAIVQALELSRTEICWQRSENPTL